MKNPPTRTNWITWTHPLWAHCSGHIRSLPTQNSCLDILEKNSCRLFFSFLRSQGNQIFLHGYTPAEENEGCHVGEFTANERGEWRPKHVWRWTKSREIKVSKHLTPEASGFLQGPQPSKPKPGNNSSMRFYILSASSLLLQQDGVHKPLKQKYTYWRIQVLT